MTDMEFLHQPRVQPYDPIPTLPTGDLDIKVEWQRMDRDNWKLGIVETERTGRVRIVIEGKAEQVAPYLDAVYQVTQESRQR